MFCKKKSSDKDLPVFTYSPLFRWVFKLLNMYFFMALKVVLQVCNGFCNNQRKGTTIDVFSSYMWSKPKSFKWCIWTIKSISSYIWIILVRHLNGQNWFLKVHSLWKNPLTECLIPSQQPKSICTHFFKLSGWPDNFLGSET